VAGHSLVTNILFVDYNTLLLPSLTVCLGADDDVAISSSQTNLYFKNRKSYLWMNEISARSPVCQVWFRGKFYETRPKKSILALRRIVLLVKRSDSPAPCTLRRRIWKRRLFLWKRIKCFPSTPRWRNLKETFGQGNHMIVTSSSSKSSVFKFLRFEGRFRKAPFFWRISVDRRPNRTNINLRRSVPESINSHHVNSFALVIDTLGIMKMTRVPPYHSTWGRDSEEVGDPPSHPTSKSALI